MVRTHKNVSKVFSAKDEAQEEQIETMDIVSAIESMGGFVFNTETKTMPKEYLKMHETFIISPDISSKRNIPAFMKKTLKISEEYQWPILKDTIIHDLATNKIGFPTDISSYLVNISSVELTVTKASAIGVTPLKAANSVRGLKIKKIIKFKKKHK